MSTEATIAVIGATTGVVGAIGVIYTIASQVRQGSSRVEVTGNWSIPLLAGPAGDPMLGITATLRRGPAVTITSYGVLMGAKPSRARRGGNFQQFRHHVLSNPLPAVLQSGGQQQASFLVDFEALKTEAAARSIPITNLWPWVELGNGDRVYADHLHKNMAS